MNQCNFVLQKDAAQKEKKDSESSNLTDIESEGEDGSLQASANTPLMSSGIFYDKDHERVNFFDSDKDLDETELNTTRPVDPNPYINQPGCIRTNPYLNA